MGFWKSLFSGYDGSAGSKTTRFERDTVGGTGDSPMSASQVNPGGASLTPTEILARNTASSSRILFSTERDIDLYELEELCDAVGWSRRPVRKVKKAIQYSFLVVSMWEVRGTQQRLIGFARATSDHAFNATIWDVVVHPDFQGKGFGKALMKYMIKKLRAEDISNITLFADPHVVDFYNRLGFISDPEGIKGMFWYPE